MGSQRSSDLSLDEEREHFRRDTERQALYQLQRARAKPVAFAVKTNCAFDGTVDDDSPVQVHSFGLAFYFLLQVEQCRFLPFPLRGRARLYPSTCMTIYTSWRDTIRTGGSAGR